MESSDLQTAAIMSKSHRQVRESLMKSMAKGLFRGLAAGATMALLLQFVLIPLFQMIHPFIAAFLTLTPGATEAAFSPLPLGMATGLASMLGNLFVRTPSASPEQLEEAQWQHALHELALEHTLTRNKLPQAPATRGARNQASFAEVERVSTNAPSTTTLQ